MGKKESRMKKKKAKRTTIPCPKRDHNCEGVQKQRVS